MKKYLRTNARLIFVSPWVLAGAIGLLTLIIVVFAANNIQREKGLMMENLFRKGQSLIGFVEAGMRAAMFSGMGPVPGNRSGVSISHTQHLIEQAIEDQDILYIAVVDASGLILNHSDPARVGQNIDRDMDFFAESAVSRGRYHIISAAAGNRKIFEVVGLFQPFRPQRGRFMNMWRQTLPQEPGEQSATGLWTQVPVQFILVGLDMNDLEKTVRQYRFQIIFLSLALLLVGLGGWISLLAAQAYRISQDSLHRIQAFTGQLISRLPVGIIATDQQGRIKTFNEAAAAMTGCAAGATVNRPPADVLPAGIAAFFERDCGQDQTADGACEQEIFLPVANGAGLTLHLSSLPVADQQGEDMGRVLLMYDLTDQKRLEKQVRRHDRLVALGKMAAGIAHEIRNPLSSIKGFATLLGDKFDPDSREQEAASLMVQEVDRLNRSITELLNYARPTPLRRQMTDMAEILRNSLRLVAADAETLGVRLDIEAVDPAVAQIYVDPDRLNQVLLNLYLNALQAMGQGGTLTVRLQPGQSPGLAEIVVRDTGCGIAEELLERVFDPYFTTKPDGTGLGLAMAYKIVDEHGGSMHFASRVGEGTTVTVSLPINAVD